MSTNSDTEDVVRKDADWMQPIDDRILEVIRDEGNLTPADIDYFGATSANHASRRCSQLARYGLLEKLVNVYRLTEEGRAYLDETFDASTLDPVDDDPPADQ